MNEQVELYKEDKISEEQAIIEIKKILNDNIALEKNSKIFKPQLVEIKDFSRDYMTLNKMFWEINEQKIIFAIDDGFGLELTYDGRDSDLVDSKIKLGKFTGGKLKELNKKKREYHAVYVAGYILNSENGKIKYLRLRNSYGEDFGDNGYFYMPAHVVVDRGYSLTILDLELGEMTNLK